MTNYETQTRTIFGTDINLNDIEKLFTAEIVEGLRPKCKFVAVRWKRLDVATDTDQDNIGVRDGGTPEKEETTVLEADLIKNGWNITACPPIIDDETGNSLDGQTREKLLRRHGEKWMPVIHVVMESPDDKRPVGILANTKHPYSKPAGWKDFATALVLDIGEKIIPRDKNEIFQRLREEYRAADYFISQGTLTKIVNLAYEKSKNDQTVVRQKDRDQWEDWLKSSGKGLDQRGKIPLLMAGGSSAPERFFTLHIIESRGKTRVILYVATMLEKQAKEDIKNFCEEVDRLWKGMFATVSENVTGLDVAPQGKGWELVGIIPQCQSSTQKIKYNMGELVSYEEYMK